MGLNQTLDRLKAEWEAKETMEHCQMIMERENTAISDIAYSIFMSRMLKDINHGMGGDKIDILIERSVMIATKLYNRLYK